MWMKRKKKEKNEIKKLKKWSDKSYGGKQNLIIMKHENDKIKGKKLGRNKGKNRNFLPSHPFPLFLPSVISSRFLSFSSFPSISSSFPYSSFHLFLFVILPPSFPFSFFISFIPQLFFSLITYFRFLPSFLSLHSSISYFPFSLPLPFVLTPFPVFASSTYFHTHVPPFFYISTSWKREEW